MQENGEWTELGSTGGAAKTLENLENAGILDGYWKMGNEPRKVIIERATKMQDIWGNVRMGRGEIWNRLEVGHFECQQTNNERNRNDTTSIDNEYQFVWMPSDLWANSQVSARYSSPVGTFERRLWN